jgi:hypothetical protein
MRVARRSLGASGCSSLTVWLCTYLNASGPSCVACNAGAGIQEPTLAPGSTSPGLPTTYDASTGEVTSNVDGSTVTNPYSAVYPNVAADTYDSSGCDLTAQSILDPTSWCSQYWTGALALGGLAFVLTVFLSGRR